MDEMRHRTFVWDTHRDFAKCIYTDTPSDIVEYDLVLLPVKYMKDYLEKLRYLKTVFEKTIPTENADCEVKIKFNSDEYTFTYNNMLSYAYVLCDVLDVDVDLFFKYESSINITIRIIQ
jgi:hypothetical protein